MLTRPECLAGGNAEVLRISFRFKLGRVDIETPGADRFDALLAQRQPVLVGEFLDFERRRAPIE